MPPLISVGEGREAACWGYSDREDRPSLGSVLDAYGERPGRATSRVLEGDR